MPEVGLAHVERLCIAFVDNRHDICVSLSSPVLVAHHELIGIRLVRTNASLILWHVVIRVKPLGVVVVDLFNQMKGSNCRWRKETGQKGWS